jgi:hypothetical protein
MPKLNKIDYPSYVIPIFDWMAGYDVEAIQQSGKFKIVYQGTENLKKFIIVVIAQDETPEKFEELNTFRRSLTLSISKTNRYGKKLKNSKFIGYFGDLGESPHYYGNVGDDFYYGTIPNTLVDEFITEFGNDFVGMALNQG